jgi:dihydrofolate synthase / folylpolyglutamate synthase
VKPEDLSYLFSLTNEYRSIRYDLRNMRMLAAALGNPQDTFDSVLIAGTNGKGSVARMLSTMMPKAGLYTSPHLIRLHERIRIGENEISDVDLKTAFERVRETIPTISGLLYPPTYFEIVTAMAFTYFQHRVDWAVLEVGLGGRLDATNIVDQKVSVVTGIGLDHQQFLGTTLEEIAAEKAGIIKNEEPVVVGPTARYPVVLERAGSRLVSTDDVWRVARPLRHGYFEVDVRTPVREYKALRLGLAGRHQIENAIVAIRAAECLGLVEQQIRTGIENVTWPGRLEILGGDPPFILDGAHNSQAVQALRDYLHEFFPNKVWMIFGAMADKPIGEMIRVLSPCVDQFILTRPESARAADPQEIGKFVDHGVVQPNLRDAVEYAKTHAPKGTAVVVCGSLYLIGAAGAMLH